MVFDGLMPMKRSPSVPQRRRPTPTPRARVADVAREAGVSTATVDRVLHGRPGVRHATVQQVLKAAARLDYLPEEDFRARARTRADAARLPAARRHQPLPAHARRLHRLRAGRLGAVQRALPLPFDRQLRSGACSPTRCCATAASADGVAFMGARASAGARSRGHAGRARRAGRHADLGPRRIRGASRTSASTTAPRAAPPAT